MTSEDSDAQNGWCDPPCGRPARTWSSDIMDCCSCMLPESVQLASLTLFNGSCGRWVRMN